MSDTTTTYVVSNADWAGGGTLSGTYTIEYDASGTPIAVTQFDLTTTGGSVAGYEYVYSATDPAIDTVTPASTDITGQQPSSSANEFSTQSTDGSHTLAVDWLGTSPTTLYVGVSGDQQTNEDVNGTDRTLSSGGSVGIACYLAGTRIATPAGDVSVETLRPGDAVLTAGGEALAVRWLGHSTISRRFADPDRILPVRIRAGALGDRLPARDLLLSPAHAVLVDGVLVNAAALVNGASIIRATDVPDVFTYYHVEFDRHALLFAEGVPGESFLPDNREVPFDNWDERTPPEAAEELPLPRAKSWRQVPRATRQRLADRAASLAPGLAPAA